MVSGFNGNAGIVVKRNGTPVGRRTAINFITDATMTDDTVNRELDIDLSTLGGSGGGTVDAYTKAEADNLLAQKANVSSLWQPNIFTAFADTASLNINNMWQVVPFGTQVIAQSKYSYNSSTSVLTVLEAGWYRVRAYVTVRGIDTTGGARGAPEIQLFHTPSGGSEVEVAGARAVGYIRENGTPLGELLAIEMPLLLAANAALAIKVLDNVGGEPNEQTAPNACSFHVDWLFDEE